jgi:autotransporter-associated beta strand protein
MMNRYRWTGIAAILLFFQLYTNGQVIWSSATGSNWLTGSNWVGGAVPGATDIAQFNTNPTSGTTGIGLNMDTASGVVTTGALYISTSRTQPLIFGNSSPATPGTLLLTGDTIAGVPAVILANMGSAAARLTVQHTQGAGGSTLTLNTGTTAKNILTSAGTATAAGSTIQLNCTVAGSGPLTYLGGGTWNGYTATGLNGGILKLGAANTFSGGISTGKADSSSAGILELDAANSMANIAGNNITIYPNSQLYLAAASGTLYNMSNITLQLYGPGNNYSATGKGALVNQNGASYTWQGPVQLNGPASVSVLGNTSVTVTLNGSIGGAGRLIKTGTGSLVLDAANSWTGGTTINGGRIVVNSSANLSNGPLAMDQVLLSPSVVLNNAFQTIGSLSSTITSTSVSNTIVLNGTRLTINQTTNTAFGGPASNQTSVITGTGSVVKTGTGTLTLTSTGNTFSGGLRIDNGTLQLNPTNGTSATLSAPDTLNGGTLSTSGLSRSITFTLGTLVVSDNSTIELGSDTIHLLRFAASSGLSWTSGKQLTINNWSGSFNGTAGTKGRVFIGTTATGATAAQLVQIRFFDGSGNSYAATQLSTGEIVPAAPVITTTPATYGPFCGNITNTVSVAFSYTGPFTGPFLVQLSGSTGVFPADFTTGIIGTGSASPISATLPAGLVSGTGYRLRVINTAPTPTFGTNNGSNITITGIPAVAAIAGPAVVGSGSGATYTNATTGGVWSVSNTTAGTISATGIFTALSLGTDTIYYQYTNSCGITGTAALLVTIVQLPLIRSVAPQIGKPGTAVTIYGSGFNSVPSANAVYFGAMRAPVTSGSASVLNVTLPAGATYAPVHVTDTISGLSAQSDTLFHPYYDTAGLIAGTFNFKPKINLNTGTVPAGTIQGDIDGDGYADLLVMNSGPNNVYVYRNNGTPHSISTATFATPVVLAAGIGPHFGKLADVDGDGRPDLIVANSTTSSPKISVFRNTSVPGSISFDARVDYNAGGAAPIDIAVADLDGDGRQEIVVVAQIAEKIAIFRNNATRGSITAASFAAPVLINTGSYPYRVIIADLDADGKPEIAVNNYYSNDVYVYHNTSVTGTIATGSFASPTVISGFTTPSGLACGDIDGDGLTDLVVLNATTNRVSVVRNTCTTPGVPAFAAAVSFTTGTGPEDMVIADMDGDKHADIVIANYTSNNITLHRNTSAIGTVTMAAPTAPFTLAAGNRPAGISAGDLDADGKPEIVLVNSTENTVSIYKNYPLPPISPITGAPSLCRGTVATYYNATGGGTWVSSNTTIGTISASGIFTAVGYGRDTITYYTVAQHDTNFARFTIQVDTFTTVGTITSAATVLCAGALLPLYNAVAGGVWVSSDTTLATIDTSGYVHGRAVGTIIATYSFTNSCGTTTDTMLITVNPSSGYVMGPVSGVPALCSGSGYLFSDTTAGGTWSSSNTAVATVASTGSVTGTGYGTAIITYGFTGSCGSYIAVASVIVDTTVLPDSITGPSQLCYGNTETYINTSAVAGTWSATNGNVTLSSAGLATAIAAGADTIVYTITNICGTVRAKKAITISARPAAGIISGPGTVCVADTIYLYATASGGNWLTTNTRATISATGRLVGVRAGLDTVFYMVANSCGADTARYVVTISAPPAPGVISGPATVCIGTSITLRDTVSGGLWYGLHGYVSVADSVVTGITAGIDSVFYAVTNGCGTSVAVKRITVGAYPFVDTISGPSQVCTGGSVTLSNSVAGGIWSRTNARAIVSSAGVVTGISAGIDTILYTVTQSGCASVAKKEMTIISNSAGTISSSSALCTGANIVLKSSVSGGVWATTGHFTSLSDSVLTGQTAGADTITYSKASSCGTATATKRITVNPQPDAGIITGANQLGTGDTIIFRSSVAGGIWAVTNTNAVISASGVVGGLREGADTAIYIVTNSCGKDTAYYPFNVQYSLKPGTITDITLKPSPNTGNFSFSVVSKKDETVSIIIADAQYKVLNLFQGVTNIEIPVTMDNVADGIYFLSAISAEGWYTVRFVIAK